MRVLVVDDDAVFLGMVETALEEDGHEVIGAPDGRTALTKAAEGAPDVIILDVRMPDMDGPAFARAYARTSGLHAPIIVVSGYPSARTRIRAAAAYLTKPFELDRLLELVRRIGIRHLPA